MKWIKANIKPADKEKVIVDCEPIGITTVIYYKELENGPTNGWSIMGVKRWLPLSVLDESPSAADSSVLVEQLRAKNPFKLNTQGSRDRGEGYEEACLMLYSLAQYNAVELEKKEGEK